MLLIPSSVMLSGAMMFEFLGWEGSVHADRGWHRAHHSAEARDLRSRAADAGRDEGRHVRVRFRIIENMKGAAVAR